jgi:hypothetical protein
MFGFTMTLDGMDMFESELDLKLSREDSSLTGVGLIPLKCLLQSYFVQHC